MPEGVRLNHCSVSLDIFSLLQFIEHLKVLNVTPQNVLLSILQENIGL
jgi:hypothetical protein